MRDITHQYVRVCGVDGSGVYVVTRPDADGVRGGRTPANQVVVLGGESGEGRRGRSGVGGRSSRWGRGGGGGEERPLATTDLGVNHEGPAAAHRCQKAVLGREVVCWQAHDVPLTNHHGVRQNTGQGKLRVHWYSQRLRRCNPFLRRHNTHGLGESRCRRTTGTNVTHSVRRATNASLSIVGPSSETCQCRPTCTSWFRNSALKGPTYATQPAAKSTLPTRFTRSLSSWDAASSHRTASSPARRR
jgi:hypothetical protein